MCSNPMASGELFVFKTPGSTHVNTIDITNEGIIVKANAERSRFDFWDQLFDEYKPYWKTSFHFVSV